jgi:hypothetical protein
MVPFACPVQQGATQKSPAWHADPSPVCWMQKTPGVVGKSAAQLASLEQVPKALRAMFSPHRVWPAFVVQHKQFVPHAAVSPLQKSAPVAHVPCPVTHWF